MFNEFSEQARSDGEKQQRAARIAGFKIASAGVLLAALNAALLMMRGQFFPVALAGSISFIFFGVTMAFLGRPIDPKTGQPPKQWTTVMLVVGLLGLGIGIALAETLKRGGS
jgi:hypothetical protein